MGARAAGEDPVARPRLPALFERTEPSAAEGGVEAVEERVAPRSGAETSIEPAPALRRVPEVPRREGQAQPVPTAAAPPPAPVRATRPPARPAVPHAEVGDSSGPLPVSAHPAVHPGGPVPSTPPAAADPNARGIVMATPPPRALPGPARPAAVARPEPPPGAAEEAPVVRVHIGRLDVRANLQPVPNRPLP